MNAMPLSSRASRGAPRSSRAAFFAFTLFGCFALATPRSASAGELESRSLFAEGRRLRGDGKCGEAIVLFHKAYDTYPDGLGALRNAAECEQETGKLASARRDWADLRIAVLRSTSPKYEGWDKDAEDAYTALAPRVAKLTLELVGERPDGLRVQLNGQPFDLRLVGVALEEDLGPISIEIVADGMAPIRRALEAKEGGAERVSITLPHVTPPPKKAGPPATAPEPPPRSGTAMRVAGGISLGIGGAGLVGALVSLGLRQSALSSVDAVCPTHLRCPSSVASDVSRGKTASTLVDVFAATAAVGAGVGLTLVLAAPSSHPKAPAPVALRFGGGPAGAGFTLQGSFR